MICPNCKKDYKDVPPGKPSGGLFRSDDHFCKKERRYGMMCTNCGFIAEFITKPTGKEYKYKKNENDGR